MSARNSQHVNVERVIRGDLSRGEADWLVGRRYGHAGIVLADQKHRVVEGARAVVIAGVVVPVVLEKTTDLPKVVAVNVREIVSEVPILAVPETYADILRVDVIRDQCVSALGNVL